MPPVKEKPFKILSFWEFGVSFRKVLFCLNVFTNQRLVIDTCPHPGLVFDIDVFVFDMDLGLVFSRRVSDMDPGLVS